MKRILIIDDDASVRNLFKSYLEMKGFKVDVQVCGISGLKQFEQSDYDLVVTDLMMPDIDGLEVIREIRQQSAQIPIVAISGGMRSGPFNSLYLAKTLGAGRTLHKPVDLEVLHQAILELFEESGLTQSE